MRRQAALFGCLLFSSYVLAQGTSGEISGVITDPSGSVVPGVNISLVHPATNAVRVVKSNESGLYVIPAIQPGRYNLKIEAGSFRTVERKDIEVQVGSSNRIDFVLELGDVASVIEVSGGAPVLQTETTSVGTVIENRRITELPLNGRNYLQLASLIPGSTTNGPSSSQGKQRMGGQRNSFALNVSGQRIHFNHYSLDGMENTDLNFNSYMLLPSIDALQEFKVESGLFAAEYGRAVAQINVSTKSGTNDLHGSVFEFLRNSALDAKNYFDRPAAPIPPFKRNQYGFTVGGPLMLPKIVNGKDKLFFLANFEGLRERKGLTQRPSVPLAAERLGDFSGNSNVIYDPATRVFDAAGNVIQAPTPFAGNRIPDDRISPVSKKLLQFFPLPQTSGRLANLTNNEARRINASQFTGRVDWNQNDASSWFFRYSWSGELGYDPFPIPNMGINTDTDVYQALVSNTRIFGATRVNEVKFSVSYLYNGHISPRANTQNVVKDLGIGIPSDNPLYWGVPNINMSSITGLGEESDAPFINYDTTIQLLDNFSWTKGKHAYKFGGEVRRVRYNQIGGVVTRGRFNFDGRYTQQPLLAAAERARTGSSVADFLLGHMNNSEGQIGAPIANFRSNYFALYLQDTWKITPKLTFNWGIRWENDQPFRDKHDAIVNIDFRWDNSIEPTFVRLGSGDPFEGNPPYPLSPSIRYVRDGRFGDRVNVNDLNDFAPRLGIAYQITPKTVLRTGFGIYYVRDIGNAVFDAVRNAPFTVRNNEPAETFRPNLSFGVPFTRTGAPTFILINQYGERSSYVNQWSFGLQRELTRDMSLEATYFGSSGVKLRRLTTYNQTFPSASPNANLTRPFPQLGGMQNMNAPSHSSYHALQLRLQQRFAHGFTLLGSYAYGKSIDNGSGIRTSDGDSLTPSDVYNLQLERGLSAFDFRQRFTGSWLYDLPIGKGQRFMNVGGIANAILGGWQFGGILTLQDGFPLTALCGPGNIQGGGGVCYPDATGISPNFENRSDKKRERFFNTAAFVDRSPGGPQFRYGNAARNTIIGPGIISFDASANKKFAFSESKYLEFRTEFFNLPNHPIFNPPGRQLRTSDYGVITSTKIDSRQIQFGLKLVF
jgi:hypothetical protein